MFLLLLFVIIGFVLLWKGSGFLITGAENIACRFRVPEFIIGITLVAFGTSAPELIVNIIASIAGKPDLILGNIIGSNIANILLILGIAGLVFPILVKKVEVQSDILLSIAGLLLFLVLANKNYIFVNAFPGLTRIDGLILLCFFLYFLFRMAKRLQADREEIHVYDKLENQHKSKKLLFDLGLFGIGMVMLPLGGHLIVKAAVGLSAILGISEIMVSIFILAFGTSLPELATSVIAAFRKKSEMAIGNIIGSNIFNLLFVLGISSLIRVIPYNRLLNCDVLVLLFASFILFFFARFGKKQIGKLKASVLFITYIAYIAFVFYRG
jgi:cation:H+ antiporter